MKALGVDVIDLYQFHSGADAECLNEELWAMLEINKPGMLVHDFPDGLSARGWYHNFQPMKLADGETMTWGIPSRHPRQRDGTAEP